MQVHFHVNIIRFIKNFQEQTQKRIRIKDIPQNDEDTFSFHFVNFE